MWYKDLFLDLETLADENKGQEMSKYMQNKFPFLGISKPKLVAAEKVYLEESKKYDLDWKFIGVCFEKEYREAQYVAIDYLRANINKLTNRDLTKLKKLIITKSWWDTVDALDAIVGNIILRYPKLEAEMIKWSLNDNIWLKRIAIDFQLQYKEKTSTKLLEKIIVNNFGSNEFFINKAIGWSLREYSKTNPGWVKDFINKYHFKMNKLSIKEASKYIN